MLGVGSAQEPRRLFWGARTHEGLQNAHFLVPRKLFLQDAVVALGTRWFQSTRAERERNVEAPSPEGSAGRAPPVPRCRCGRGGSVGRVLGE